MNENQRNLIKLKVVLAASGLMATLAGAGWLGEAAATLAAQTVNNDVATVTSDETNITTLDSTGPAALDLDLEAIPTVVAPNSVTTVRAATGRSSR